MESNAPDWRALLDDAIAEAGKKGKAHVATQIGVSRVYVSRVTSLGQSGMSRVSQKFIDRVIERYHRVDCPATGEETPRAQCHKANGPAPTHNPLAMRVWRACQTCEHKPAKEKLNAA